MVSELDIDFHLQVALSLPFVAANFAHFAAANVMSVAAEIWRLLLLLQI